MKTKSGAYLPGFVLLQMFTLIRKALAGAGTYLLPISNYFKGFLLFYLETRLIDFWWSGGDNLY
jgi:hypothetical protein